MLKKKTMSCFISRWCGTNDKFRDIIYITHFTKLCCICSICLFSSTNSPVWETWAAAFPPDPSLSQMYVTPNVREPHKHTLCHTPVGSSTSQWGAKSVFPWLFSPGPLILSPGGEIPSQSFKSVQHKSSCFRVAPSPPCWLFSSLPTEVIREKVVAT